MVKILIVDDEKSICESLTWILEKEGYYVRSEADFKKAKEIVEKDEFDIYFIDLVFPSGNGLELIKLIKGQNKNALIIVITGYPSMPTLIESIRSEVYDYISKPISIDDVIKIVDHAITLLNKKGMP
ncbi:MAG: response regulator [Candidatus Helarchaeota archaeon]